MKTKENYGVWSLDEAVGYYEKLRNKPEDIYKSEKIFLFTKGHFKG